MFGGNYFGGAYSGEGYAPTHQYARPTADFGAGSWTTTPLWSKVDEIAWDDADAISSEVRVTPGTTSAVQLTHGAVSPPGVNTNHVLRIRAKATFTLGSAATVRVQLVRSGITFAQADFAVTSSYQVFVYNLTTTEAGNIGVTGYAHLETDTVGIFAAGNLGSVQVSWVEIAVPNVVVGAHVLAVGTASSTGTALPITRTKTRALGIASETDSAIVFARVKTRALGIATEADVADRFAITFGINKATETDTAIALTRVKARSLGIVSEVDTAILLGRIKTKAIGIATGANAALAISRHIFAINIANEVDAAIALGRRKTKAIGIVSESDTAVLLGRLKTKAIGIGSETDTGRPIAHFTVTLGIAGETDSAVLLGRIHRRALGLVSESDTAIHIPRTLLRTVGIASATNTALAIAKKKIEALGTAVETDFALALLISGVALPQWQLEVLIIRVSATTVRYAVRMHHSTLAEILSVGQATGLDLTAANVLKVTGEAAAAGAATNDIVAKLGTGSFVPAA